MLKEKVILIILLFCGFNLSAQKESNVTLKLAFGVPLFSESQEVRFFGTIEPKLKTSKNTIIGLRFGITVNTHVIENKDRAQFSINDGINESDNGVISFVPTFDYCLRKNKFRPYVGLGVGYYFLGTYIYASRTFVSNPSEDTFEIDVKEQVGLLLRGGFELGRVVIGLEYNLIPKADIEIPTGQVIGTVDKSYIGLSVGYTFGNRKRLE